MELELSEEQIKSFAGQGLKLVVLIVAIYGFWTFLLSPLLDSLEQGAKKDALANAGVLNKQICSDTDSYNKLQQDPKSANPSVERMRQFLAAYKTMTGQEFNISSCLTVNV
jgi:hypothetical protein